MHVVLDQLSEFIFVTLQKQTEGFRFSVSVQIIKCNICVRPHVWQRGLTQS